jgi:hypothetical protein
MANRKRLTKEGFSRRASDVENADPNSLNRVRHVPDAEEYMTWDPEANENHEKPDMRHDWQGDAAMRHETLNVAMPGRASQANLALLRTAQTLAKKSSLAIKVANALFPEGTEDFIEKQATDLMDLPLRSLIDTVARINKYAAEMEEMDELDIMDAEGDMGAADMGAAPAVEMPAAKEDWQKGGEDPMNAPADFGSPANMPPAEMSDVPKMDLGAMAEEPAEEELAEEEESAEEGDELEFDMEDSEEDDAMGDVASGGDAAGAEDVDLDGEAGAKMAAAIKASHAKTASKVSAKSEEKRGVKKIASAPRANGSSFDVDSLSRLWKSDPDVSDHFNY